MSTELALSQTEQTTLQHCETTIAKGMGTFLEVGEALMTVQQQRLYRTEHKNFEDYLQQRWQIGKAHAHRLIAAANTHQNLTADQSGDKLPKNESQYRELARLKYPPDQQTVWSKVLEQHNAPTAVQVRQAVDEYLNQRPGDIDEDVWSQIKEWSHWSYAGRSEDGLHIIKNNGVVICERDGPGLNAFVRHHIAQAKRIQDARAARAAQAAQADDDDDDPPQPTPAETKRIARMNESYGVEIRKSDSYPTWLAYRDDAIIAMCSGLNGLEAKLRAKTAAADPLATNVTHKATSDQQPAAVIWSPSAAELAQAARLAEDYEVDIQATGVHGPYWEANLGRMKVGADNLEDLSKEIFQARPPAAPATLKQQQQETRFRIWRILLNANNIAREQYLKNGGGIKAMNVPGEREIAEAHFDSIIKVLEAL